MKRERDLAAILCESIWVLLLIFAGFAFGVWCGEEETPGRENAAGMETLAVEWIQIGEARLEAEPVPAAEAAMCIFEGKTHDAEPLLDLCEDTYIRNDVPLTYEEQRDLYGACLEFNIPYPLMLGLIERETAFVNTKGDGGSAWGYCQIWSKWWGQTAKDIGAVDLMVPKDNFRTACAALDRLRAKYGSMESALTYYNTGHPGKSTYAADVMKRAERYGL